MTTHDSHPSAHTVILPPAGGLACLPTPFASPLRWDPLGALVMRPWYDRMAVNVVARWYLTLSRAWAAALASGGDPASFAGELGLERLPQGLCGWQVARGLAATTMLARVHAGAEAHWQDVFFGAGAPSDATLVAAERGRRRSAHNLMAARRHFSCLRKRIDPLRWAIPRPAEMPPMSALQGDGGTCIQLPGEPSAFPAVELSHWVPGPYGRQAWLRFAAPGLPGDTAWAQVFEPVGVANPPTLISLHGICMESEHWGRATDSVDVAPALALKGLRVIRPEGPWHGRRQLPGTYGGEPAMAQGPLGFLKLFRAWGAEVAVMIDWARRQGSAQVALGGVSLGALTSQLIAVAAKSWPAELRPDALVLIACSEDLKDVAFQGSLAAAIGLPARLAAQGWTEADVGRYLPLMEPRGEPAMASGKIVMVLGEADDLTPFSGGLALARRWQVPPVNLFLRPQGHFSVAFDLARRPQPLDRLVEILGSA
ncbi:MAG: hypothetical protein GEU89_08145 [Kiloniellaceae bacterium]|nr:hypothetical protein [Kiloniellaceae bacterium]